MKDRMIVHACMIILKRCIGHDLESELFEHTRKLWEGKEAGLDESESKNMLKVRFEDTGNEDSRRPPSPGSIGEDNDYRRRIRGVRSSSFESGREGFEDSPSNRGSTS